MGDVVAVGWVVAGRLRFAARQREHLPHQLHAAQGGAVDFADALVQLLRVGFLQGQFCLADDARQRGAQLVGGVVEEALFGFNLFDLL